MGRVKLPLDENVPPHCTSMVSGSVMSVFTWTRLRNEMAGPRWDPDGDRRNSAARGADAAACNRRAPSASRVRDIGRSTLIGQDDRACALNLKHRHSALDRLGV